MHTDDPTFWLQRIEIDMSVLDLMNLHDNACLALRHPRNVGEVAERMRELVVRMGTMLVATGALTLEEVVEAQLAEGIGGPLPEPPAGEPPC